MSYATYSDVTRRTTRSFNEAEKKMVLSLLEDAAVLIDSYHSSASVEAKRVVSCRMVLRTMGEEDSGLGVPMGATQGSMAAGGYSQSWTIGSGGGSGELYISKLEKKLLGVGDRIGSRSPVEGMVRSCD